MTEKLSSRQVETSVWFDGLAFPESPRWHDGLWWFVDMHRGEVWVASAGGEKSLMVDWGSPIGGLGWLPSGDLLFVDKHGRTLMRRDRESEQISLYADMSSLVSSYCNDLLVLPDGAALTGTYGFNPALGEPFKKAELLVIDPRGRPRLAAEGLSFPNGMVIDAARSRLVLAETLASRLVEYSSELTRGALADRRTLVKFERYQPDGICIDPLGNVWLAPLTDRELVQVNISGDIVKRVSTQGFPVACALGGVSQGTLLITSIDKPLHELAIEDYYNPSHGLVEVIDLHAP